MSIAELPDQLQQRLKAECKPGEFIAWAGQPNPRRYMRTGFLLWLFFIPWTAFSVFWTVGAAQFQVPRFDSTESLFPLFGLPFVLIGIAGLCSPFWLYHRAFSIIYAISDRRAIVIEGKNSITVNSYAFDTMANIERKEHQDGSGDLIFKTESYKDSDGDTQTKKCGFFHINSVRRVQEVLEKNMRSE